MRWVWLVLASGCSFSSSISDDTPRDGNPEGIDAIDSGIDSPDGMTGPCAALQIESMSAQNCVLRTDNEVWCWGRNEDGAIGAPSSPQNCSGGQECVRIPTKVTFPGNPTITKLGLGDRHSCALSGTQAYCWGFNMFGEYGDGTTTSQSTPREITLRAATTQIRGGDVHTCGLQGASVTCSGQNMFSEIGDNTTMERDIPTAATIVGTPTAIGLGFHHSCAIVGGAVHCWGENDAGQVFGAGNPVGTPRAVTGVTNAASVAAGVQHTCARINDGSLRCWGANGNGQLGIGNTTAQAGVVTPTISGVTQLAAGVNHNCVLANAGVWCWGEGYTSGPTQINFGGMAAKAVSAGSYHDCAILVNGTVRCWGFNAYSQLGNNSTTSTGTTPVTAVVCP